MTETPVQNRRTPEQTRRRLALHNAAAGHTRVVLYLCTRDDSTTPADAVRALRLYAAARDWEVSQIILDGSPLNTPLDNRDQWIAARGAIADRRAEGIVTLQGHTCDTVPEIREPLLQWLAEQGAFVSGVQLARRVPVSGQVTT